MGITRLNHAVLYVGDLRRSVDFYCTALGFRLVDLGSGTLEGAAFLQAPDSTNDHDLGLCETGPDPRPSGAGRGTVGLYHLAWEVDTLEELEHTAARLTRAAALVGATDHGTTKSLYGVDPDGIEFEVVWLVPGDLLDQEALDARARLAPLDLAAAKRRYGATTRGGVGVSTPA